jgi:hypothetical protein
MRGWICCLQLLLVIASAVILRFESHGAHDHILLSHIRNFPKLEGPDPRIYIPQEQGGPVITPPPPHWIPFSSPPTNRRATVEVLEPASMKETFNS